MNVLTIKYLKTDISNSDMDKIKLSIPIANELTKNYKSEDARKQTLLGRYLIINNLNCKEEDIYYNSLKKPYVKNNIYFNVSHSKEYVVFVKSNTEIGIDIELVDENNLSIMDYAFTNDEINYVNNIKNNFQNINERLTLVWTIKESLFKASGIEAKLEPKDIDTCKKKLNDQLISGKNFIENEIIFNRKKYFVYSIMINGYIISVASEEKKEDIILEKVNII